MSVEVEIKLKINSRTDIERVLEETGFVRADLVLESDTYYTVEAHKQSFYTTFPDDRSDTGEWRLR